MNEQSRKDVSVWSNSWKAISALAFCALLSACGAPGQVPNTPEGKAAIMDAVNIALSNKDCTNAIALIEDLYDSEYSDNEVRLLRASAHGCAANIVFFTLLSSLASEDINGAEFWETMTKLFPSSDGDSRVESGWYATDALFAALKAGSIIEEDEKINASTNNVGSVVASQRVDDANAYLIFVSMAVIGALQNRFGDPAANYQKQTDLPWSTQATMDTDGCSYTASILNLLDGINVLSTVLSGTLASSLANTYNSLNTAITLGCQLGCVGANYNGVPFFDPDCNYALADCTGCDILMRSRQTCMADVKSQCEAAGIVRFINNDATNGWRTSP